MKFIKTKSSFWPIDRIGRVSFGRHERAERMAVIELGLEVSEVYFIKFHDKKDDGFIFLYHYFKTQQERDDMLKTIFMQLGEITYGLA